MLRKKCELIYLMRRFSPIGLSVVLMVLCHHGPVVAQTIAVQGTRLDVDLYGNIFVLDGERSTLRLFTKQGIVKREMGGPGWQNDQFDRPSGIWARNGIDVFVADYGNHRIQRFDRSLNYVSTLYTRDNDNPDERFGYPADVCLSRLGELFICDTENSRIVKVNRSSQVERVFGGFGAGKGRLQNPLHVAVGPRDYVYILDGSRIVIFDSFGNFISELAEGVFTKPSCLFADNDGVVVVDAGIMYCFDEQNRPSCRLPVDSVAGLGKNDIGALSFAGGFLYALTESGLHVVPDPRSVTAGNRLDKDKKSQ